MRLIILSQKGNRMVIRKSPRLKDYDYQEPGAYFVTVCVSPRRNLFWKTPIKIPDFSIPTGYLNENGNIVAACLEQLINHRQVIHLLNFVIMPDHVHILLEHDGDGNGISINNLVGEFKRLASLRLRKRMKGEKIWQRSFFDRIVRNDREYQRIDDYIEANPVNWEEDQESPDFL